MRLSEGRLNIKAVHPAFAPVIVSAEVRLRPTRVSIELSGCRTLVLQLEDQYGQSMRVNVHARVADAPAPGLAWECRTRDDGLGELTGLPHSPLDVELVVGGFDILKTTLPAEAPAGGKPLRLVLKRRDGLR
jgi:hypothetical protein